jgi:hypothetical protein
MFTVSLSFLTLRILVVGLYRNGVVVIRLGTTARLEWTMLSLFYDRAERTVNIQLCSKRTLTVLNLGGRNVR